MNNSRKNIMLTTLTMIVLAAALIFGFYTITKGKGDEGGKKPKTEAEALLAKDLAEDYPETPGEVVKLYFRFTKCIYQEKVTDEEITGLVDQMRALFDKELLANNPKESHLLGIRQEMESYAEDGLTILDYSVDSSKETEFGEIESTDYAALQAKIIMLDKKKKRTNTVEDFLLRQDEDGRWKILQWQLSME